MIENVAEKLASEIRRVTTIREHYKRLDGMPGVNVKPAMAMMDYSLQAAIAAAGQDDALTQIAAVKDLQGYSE